MNKLFFIISLVLISPLSLAKSSHQHLDVQWLGFSFSDYEPRSGGRTNSARSFYYLGQTITLNWAYNKVIVEKLFWEVGSLLDFNPSALFSLIPKTGFSYLYKRIGLNAGVHYTILDSDGKNNDEDRNGDFYFNGLGPYLGVTFQLREHVHIGATTYRGANREMEGASNYYFLGFRFNL